MRRIPTLLSLATLLLAACGFDTTPPGPAGGSGAGNVGGSSSSSSGASGSAGMAPSAGQPSTGGSTNAQGGSSNQAGSVGASTAGSSAMGGTSTGGSAGTAGSAGSSMGGMAGSGGTSAIDPHFKLKWHDDFDSFDGARWLKRTHTFAENLAQFSAANVAVEGGFLKLRVTKMQTGSKDYAAAEVASTDQFTFGRFAGRIKFCAGSGMVSSLFTYKENVNQSWQEIDIEHLGNLSKSVQYNLISGTQANRVYQPKVVNLQYLPPAEFHDYVIEWKPDAITFFIDGKQVHQDVQASIKDAATLHMNAWPTDNAVTSFAGPFDPNAVPCEAQYDWVEAYTYSP